MVTIFKTKYLKSPKHVIEVEVKKQFPNWAPAAYLWKSASVKPKEIIEIILELKTPVESEDRNPWLLEFFVKSAIEMPPKYGKLLVKKIYKEKWLLSPYHHYLDHPISELMLKLAESGYEEEALQLVKILLDVKLGDPYVVGGIIEEYKKIQDVKPVIDSYWYEELLKNQIPVVFEKFPKPIINVLTDSVIKVIYLENLGKGDKNSKTDSSIGWRPAIENHEQNSGFQFQSKLLGTLGMFLIELGTKSPRILKTVLKKISKIKYPAFRRLELYVYWTFPKYFKNEINHAVENYFGIYELHHEYFHLLKIHFLSCQSKLKKIFQAHRKWSRSKTSRLLERAISTAQRRILRKKNKILETRQTRTDFRTPY